MKKGINFLIMLPKLSKKSVLCNVHYFIYTVRIEHKNLLSFNTIYTLDYCQLKIKCLTFKSLYFYVKFSFFSIKLLLLSTLVILSLSTFSQSDSLIQAFKNKKKYVVGFTGNIYGITLGSGWFWSNVWIFI